MHNEYIPGSEFMREHSSLNASQLRIIIFKFAASCKRGFIKFVRTFLLLTNFLQIPCYLRICVLQRCFIFHNMGRVFTSTVKPTRCTTVSNLFYFGMTLYMFRTVFPSIIRSSRILTITGICQTVNPAMGKITSE